MMDIVKALIIIFAISFIIAVGVALIVSTIQHKIRLYKEMKLLKKLTSEDYMNSTSWWCRKCEKMVKINYEIGDKPEKVCPYCETPTRNRSTLPIREYKHKGHKEIRETGDW